MADRDDETSSTPGPICTREGMPVTDILGQSVIHTRPVYSLPSLRPEDTHTKTTVAENCRTMCSKVSTACKNQFRVKKILRFVPFVQIMKEYHVKKDLAADVAAGLTIGIMNIPQGMAYAFLASLAPIYGLYVSFFPVLVYFFFGTSKHLSMGAASIVSMMTGNLVESNLQSALASGALVLPANGSHISNSVNGSIVNNELDLEEIFMSHKIETAVAATFLAGIFQMGLGFLKLGKLTVYLSPPLISGFTTGAAVHVFSSQVKYVLDIKIPRHSGIFNLLYTYVDVCKNLTQAKPAALVISAICIMVLITFKEFITPRFRKRFKFPLPVELVLVVVGALASKYGEFHEKYQVGIVGNIPAGFKEPQVPQMSAMGGRVGDAFALAMVGFTISVSLAHIFAQRYDYEIDPNQELIAMGTCNFISSFFRCFSCCASLSRSSVLETVGGKTQLAGVVSCLLMLVVLLVAGPFFQPLPKCVLASIIVVAIKQMFLEFRELRRLWRISKYDAAVWAVSFASVTILDVDVGLGISVAFSLAMVVLRTQWPSVQCLGVIPGTESYVSVKDSIEKVKELDGIKIIRFEDPLCFTNAEYFQSEVFKLSEVNPKDVKRRQKKMAKAKSLVISPEGADVQKENGAFNGSAIYLISATRHLILDCSCMAYVDSVGARALGQIIQEYRDVGISVYLANCSENVRELLSSAEFLEIQGSDTLHLTIHDAVLSILQTDGHCLNNGKVETSSEMNLLQAKK